MSRATWRFSNVKTATSVGHPKVDPLNDAGIEAVGVDARRMPRNAGGARVVHDHNAARVRSSSTGAGIVIVWTDGDLDRDVACLGVPDGVRHKIDQDLP